MIDNKTLTPTPLGRLITRKLEASSNSVAWLAENIGVSTQAVYKWGSSGKIGRDNLAKLVEVLKLDDDELREALGHDLPARAPHKTPTINLDEFVIVPFHPSVRSKLGDGYENDDRAPANVIGLSFRLESLRRQRIDPECCFVLMGDGESMLPTLRSGDAMMVDESQATLSEGLIYCWEKASGALLIKRFGYDDAGRDALLSENPDPKFKPIPLTPDIRVLGRVVWRSGWI